MGRKLERKKWRRVSQKKKKSLIKGNDQGVNQGKKSGEIVYKQKHIHTHTEINSVTKSSDFCCCFVSSFQQRWRVRSENGSQNNNGGQEKGDTYTDTHDFLYKRVIHHQLINQMSL